MYTSKSLQLFIAITLAILTTGFLRLQLFSGVPAPDDGFYIFHSQYIYYALTHGQDLKTMTLSLYQFMTAWVYGLEVNQYILLRLIDGLVAVAASIILFKVILKESGNTLFTAILATALFIIMNDIENIAYGFRNSIWAAYLPLFTALLVWQNASKEDKYSFYLIGGLVSLGVLLREPFLPFFLLAGISILIGYGWRVLIKYLIGSAVVGFSVLAVMLMFRGWDLFDLINSYHLRLGAIGTLVIKFPMAIIKANWFILTTASISFIYLIKLYCADKKSVNMSRVYFWLVIALLPLVEYYTKLGLPYHMANTLIGFSGLTAIGWQYLEKQESRKINKSSIIIIGLLSLIVILPTINRTLIKSSYIYGPIDAIKWVKASDSFRGGQMIERSQYLKVAAKVYGLTRSDSTLAVSGFWQPLFPLTGLLPPTFKLHDLRALYLASNYDENKIIEYLIEYQPTVIVSSTKSWPGERAFPGIIEKTDFYEKVTIVSDNPQENRGGPGGAIVYRLKDF
jgi:hypothetical protein